MDGTVPDPKLPVSAPEASEPSEEESHAPTRRILLVDDEPNLLSGLKRMLCDDFEIETATSGQDALRLLSEGRYAVVVSDMRMPVMTGAALLANVRALDPGIVRILLTGESDMQSAILAVNEGAIFRFLTKPCPSTVLVKTLEQALEQHALIRAERELLDGTLRGIVKVMTDVLALVSPGVFLRATRLKTLVSHVAKQLHLSDVWIYEVAALLSPIGCIALPEELVARAFAGQEVTDAELGAFASHPQTAFKLLGDIPRFEKIAAVVRGQPVTVERAAPSDDPDPEVAMGITLLRAAYEVERLVARGASHRQAAAELKAARSPLPANILSAIESYKMGADEAMFKILPIAQLTVGMVCDEDVLATSGSVVIPKGIELGVMTLERLRKFALNMGVREPVRVRIG